MAIGNCCLLWGIYHTNYKTLKLSSVTKKSLEEAIKYNLISLGNAINFSIENKIKFFRLSSDIIPFGSSKINTINWSKVFKKELSAIGHKIKINKIRVSFHPGQYSVLNSPDSKVVNNTVDDLEYHALLLDCLELDDTHKMVLHIGGVYGDKEAAIKRFAKNFDLLSLSAKNRLIIENDDKSYHTEDALKLSKKAYDKYATPEFKELMEKTKLGNHPAIIETFKNAGVAIGNDTLVTPSINPVAPKVEKSLADHYSQKK